ncbi:MAG: Crp/Fnr family transcriptional regulator [Gammaproteobacteria bacterium]|nr:Crp/Fnr family transcriptional regulator [Gammaproteobacteria bacterium]
MDNILTFLTGRHDVREIVIPVNTIVCEIGDACENFVVLTKGRVKIFRTGEDGRYLTLYQVCPGEGCVLTASCLLNDRAFPAIAIAEEPSEGYVISKQRLRDWLKTEPEWQKFIFELLSQRMGSLIEIVDQLAFKTLETRLIQWLVVHPQAPSLKITHQQVAKELASSREVISRLLKILEEKGKVKLQRGRILIV